MTLTWWRGASDDSDEVARDDSDVVAGEDAGMIAIDDSDGVASDDSDVGRETTRTWWQAKL